MIESERTDPPLRADETTTLLAFLDYHRNTFRSKTAGLDHAQLCVSLPPASMTLAGMLKHLAYVEDHWFNKVLMGGPGVEPWASVDWEADYDWEWHSAIDSSPEELRALFDASVAASEAILADVLPRDGLDTESVAVSRREGQGCFSLRWILVHLIAEYARHNGHADLIRESIDGSTGD